MITIEATQETPLIALPDGSIRLKNSRVTLDSIVQNYRLGATAEQIADSFPSVSLADIHAVISYYLSHRETIEAYLQQRWLDAEKIRQQIESVQENRQIIRERLLARKMQNQK